MESSRSDVLPEKPSRYKVVLLPGWAQPKESVQHLVEVMESWSDVAVIELKAPEGKLRETLGKELEVDQPTLVVGWSLGGSVAIRLLQSLVAKPRGIVLIGVNPFFVGDQNWPGVGEALFQDFTRQLEEDPQRLLQKFSGLIMLGDADARQLTKNARRWHGPVLEWSPELLQLSLAWLKEWDVRELLEGVSTPVLHLLGEADRLVPGREVAEEIKSRYPGQSVDIVKEMGHYPSPAVSDHLVERIRAFVGGE
ncbi:alpha/beta fold hydrolase [Hahella sp. CCB-MM4]|uniref:alpha/beta fold hydrolase n=1 Tax=Hahella sp. (strain CCB-MM4) TaxID=1926491 RepID=UPI00143D65AD|nr:alpha/beta fold hydrolase [Hahella sp. CCB-MM4]